MSADTGIYTHEARPGALIELLSIPGCAAAEELQTRISRVAAAFAPDIGVQLTTVHSLEEARELGFIGSPSLRVNGLDIEIARRADAPSFSCRLYENNGKRASAPPDRLLAEALARRGKPKKRVLFLCTGNSCRSQMAEGWAGALLPDLVEPFSAGIETHGLNPNAVSVMAESGIDISAQRSQHISEFSDFALDLVVTVCGHADRHCPAFPGTTRVVHAGFEDPPKLAAQAKTEEEALGHYRRVRDQIRDFVLQLPATLATGTGL